MDDSDGEFVVSGFGDEISDDLATQLDVMAELGLAHLDLRSVDGTNVLDLSDAQITDINATLTAHEFSIASLGSPIGKIGIDEDFASQTRALQRAMELAETFETPYIRVFSYYIPEGDDPADWRGEVMHRMTRLAELAEPNDITLLVENEHGLYGDIPRRCRDILTTVNSPALQANFDPANYVTVGIRPYPDALFQLVEYVEYLHIKDATPGSPPTITPAGEGASCIPAIIETLLARGFTGGAALEPHLETAGSRGGYSGPDGFRRATRAFLDILHDVGASFR